MGWYLFYRGMTDAPPSGDVVLHPETAVFLLCILGFAAAIAWLYRRITK